jgi:predicted RNase H-like HicB family nuclease
MKRYYALFKKSDAVVEVEFPDLEGCVTFGEDWDEAYENAIDALAAWLAHAQANFVHSPSQHNALAHLQGELVPVPVDEKILESYAETKRINIIISSTMLEKIDEYCRKSGLKRSTILMHAATEYLEKHQTK